MIQPIINLVLNAQRALSEHHFPKKWIIIKITVRLFRVIPYVQPYLKNTASLDFICFVDGGST